MQRLTRRNLLTRNVEVTSRKMVEVRWLEAISLTRGNWSSTLPPVFPSSSKNARNSFITRLTNPFTWNTAAHRPLLLVIAAVCSGQTFRTSVRRLLGLPLLSAPSLPLFNLSCTLIDSLILRDAWLSRTCLVSKVPIWMAGLPLTTPRSTLSDLVHCTYPPLANRPLS